MDAVVDFARRNKDLVWKVAVGAMLVALFWQQVQGLYAWYVGNDVLDDSPGFGKSNGVQEWFAINYFVETYLAALIFGLLVARWEAVKVAVLGFLTGLVVITGPILTHDEFRSTSGDIRSYFFHTLEWTWIFGLIALGVFIGRKLGNPFDELDEPAAP